MALLRLPAVIRLSGYSRSMIYALIAQGLYPRPIKISERSVAWPSHEVERMVRAVISNCSQDERRNLVIRMEQDRKLDCSTSDGDV